MARLSDESKRLIVQRLATFVSPSEIQAELKEMKVNASLPQIMYYDPESAGTDLAEKWKDLHAQTREQFISETAAIAISHRSFRLRELDRLYRIAARGQRPNLVLAKELLVEAERFTGEAYTNRRKLEHSGKVDTGGAPSLDDLTDEQLAALALRLASAGEASP